MANRIYFNNKNRSYIKVDKNNNNYENQKLNQQFLWSKVEWAKQS
jgi:hypothetical protein